MALYLTHRPKSLDDLIGNDSIKESLKTVLTREDKPHVFLFHGASGCGKTTISRIIADMIEIAPDDLYEFNAANTRGIDTMREIIQNSHFAPLVSKRKMYILDEAGRITVDGQNSLLKVLEDCPKHVFFCLCTTEPDKILKTIRTRCTTYQVQALTDKEMKSLLLDILKREGVKDFPEKVIDAIIRVSDGSARQALVTLDSVIDITDDEEALKAIYSADTKAEVIDICRALVNGTSWDSIKGKVKIVLQNTEPEKVRWAILGYLGAVLYSDAKNKGRISKMLDIFSENCYNGGKFQLANMIFIGTLT